jgi:hypothetical protein
MSRRDPERGQATVEWIGLLLGIALVLGAVAAGGREAAKGESAVGLGDAVAERIVCAAKGACAEKGAVRPRPRAVRPTPRQGAPTPQHRRDAGIGSGVAKRAWFLCLGYRRWQYDREHAPFQRVPLRENLKTVNECVNPLAFLF